MKFILKQVLPNILQTKKKLCANLPHVAIEKGLLPGERYMTLFGSVGWQSWSIVLNVREACHLYPCLQQITWEWRICWRITIQIAKNAGCLWCACFCDTKSLRCQFVNMNNDPPHFIVVGFGWGWGGGGSLLRLTVCLYGCISWQK